jgi:hypothetical protein
MKSYSVDGVVSGSLAYVNKQYALDLTFKNVAASWTFTTAKLIYIGGYNVLQGTASLGTLSNGSSKVVSFLFTRDSTDDSEFLPMRIAISDGISYTDTIDLILPITGDNIYTKPPVIASTGYTVDGVANGTLEYLNKKYALGVSVKNTGGLASITATLLPKKGYTVQQGISALGAMATDGSKTATFEFTRDSSDNGTALPMDIRVTDNKKYTDTLHITLGISGSKIFDDAGVNDLTPTTNRISVIPNPAAGSAKLLMELYREGNVTLTFTDIMGRTVRTMHAGSFAQGASVYELPLEGMTRGIYTIRLECSSGEQHITWLVLQ